MSKTVLCVLLGSVLLGSTAVAQDHPARKTAQNQANRESMSPDMRRAIEFQRAKDRADARQAAIEARHPTVFYHQANREAEDNSMPGKKVLDPGPAVKK